MAAELDVIAKLSRILETHSFGNDVASEGGSFENSELGQFIAKATSATPSKNFNYSTVQNSDDARGGAGASVSPPRTPFEAWQKKVTNQTGQNAKEAKAKVLTESQKDGLVDQLFRTKKNKERCN